MSHDDSDPSGSQCIWACRGDSKQKTHNISTDIWNYSGIKVSKGTSTFLIRHFTGTMSRRGGGRPMPREVVLSKALSHLLRHSAEKENLKISKEGYVNVADLVREMDMFSLFLESSSNEEYSSKRER